VNPGVDAYLAGVGAWRDELAALRAILLDCELTEEVKWRQPCYTFEGGNVAILGEMKAHGIVSFFKGSLLEDPAGVLVKPGENSRAGRLIPFTSVGEVTAMEPILRAYVAEAIEIEKAGLKVDFTRDAVLEPPSELLVKFDEDPGLKAAFDALTPGRRRGYVLHFTEPKQSKTRTARIEKATPRILAGKGRHDR